MKTFISKVSFIAAIVAAGVSFAALPARADLSPEVRAKVDLYKAKLSEWAHNPVLVAAVREANARGAMPGMTNAKWYNLAETDPMVVDYQNSPAGRLLHDLDDGKAISKLYLRDANGNLVAGSSKPILYNNVNRAPFFEAFKGAPFAAHEVKPDTSTQIKGVQLSVPVMDKGKPIGVLQTSVVAD